MPLTWSISRDRTLHTCERQYYYQYLAPARINSRDPILREIAFLKKLKNIPTWQGEAFHSALSDYLKSILQNRNISTDPLLSRVRSRMEREWEFSKSRAFRDDPRAIDQDGGLALFEHEYEEEQSVTACTSSIQFVEQSIVAISEWAEEVNLPHAIQTASQVWIEPPIFGPNALGYMVDGVKVIIKVDLALLHPDGQFEIFDWKTGKPSTRSTISVDKAEFQINVYQLWPCLALQHPVGSIRAYLVYPATNPILRKDYRIDQNVYEYTLSLVRRSVARVRRFGDTETDVALHLADFDFAAFAAACKRCAFKRLCQRTLDE